MEGNEGVYGRQCIGRHESKMANTCTIALRKSEHFM